MHMVTIESEVSFTNEYLNTLERFLKPAMLSFIFMYLLILWDREKQCVCI